MRNEERRRRAGVERRGMRWRCAQYPRGYRLWPSCAASSSLAAGRRRRGLLGAGAGHGTWLRWAMSAVRPRPRNQAGLMGWRNEPGRVACAACRPVPVSGDCAPASALNNLAAELRAAHRQRRRAGVPVRQPGGMGRSSPPVPTRAPATSKRARRHRDPQSAVNPHFERALAPHQPYTRLARSRARSSLTSQRWRWLAAPALAHLAQAVALARRNGQPCRSDRRPGGARRAMQQFGRTMRARPDGGPVGSASRPDRAAESRALCALGGNHCQQTASPGVAAPVSPARR